MLVVIEEVRRTWKAVGGRGRFSKTAAYNDAARIRINAACTCEKEGDGGWDMSDCRFHAGDDYYSQVRDRLAQWLEWADTHPSQ